MKTFTKDFHDVFAPSQYLANRAQRFLQRDVRVIRHGSPSHRQHIGGRGFVFVGGIDTHKGPHIVQQAHQKSHVSHIPLSFYGPRKEPTLIPSDNWFGTRSNQEILEILQHSDALVMGSIWPENAPLVITEALSVGCPVIAPRIGGIPEMLIEGTNGWLYTAGDVDDLARKLSKYHTISGFEQRPPLFSDVTKQYIDAYRKSL